MKILLPTDGSAPGRAAVDYLLAFPLPASSEVTVMTAIREVLPKTEVKALSEEHRQAYEQVRREADAEAQALLDGEVERLRQAGLSADSRICIGNPAEEIVRLATELGSDMIAIGSHGHTGTKRFLLGSTSDRVFEYAPCSVLIVKYPDATAGIEQSALPEADGTWRLLIAFDDSPPARKAIEFCSSLPLLGRATVTTVTVMPMIHMYRQDIRQQLNWIWQEKKQAAETALQTATDQLAAGGVEVASELIENTDVAQALLDIATERGDDLIIVGHKGKKVFERFLLGSVTARIAHHAPCSVLSVRR